MKLPQSTLYIPLSFVGFMLILGGLLILITQFGFHNYSHISGYFTDVIGALCILVGGFIFYEEMTAPDSYDRPEP